MNDLPAVEDLDTVAIAGGCVAHGLHGLFSFWNPDVQEN
jgi:hypothetical protein